MDISEAIERILPAFEQYYTVIKDSKPPFCAQAEFRSHNEQYFLVRSAHIADIDSNEFVYFATTPSLSNEQLEELVNASWQDGLSKVKPYNGHRNSDVSLIIITNSLDKNVSFSEKNKSFSGLTRKSMNIIELIKKTKLYKSYKWSLHGWSHFKLAVVELETQVIYFNRFGKDYKKLLEKNIFNNS